MNIFRYINKINIKNIKININSVYIIYSRTKYALINFYSCFYGNNCIMQGDLRYFVFLIILIRIQYSTLKVFLILIRHSLTGTDLKRQNNWFSKKQGFWFPPYWLLNSCRVVSVSMQSLISVALLDIICHLSNYEMSLVLIDLSFLIYHIIF